MPLAPLLFTVVYRCWEPTMQKGNAVLYLEATLSGIQWFLFHRNRLQWWGSYCKLHADPLMSKQRLIFRIRTQVDREATGSQDRVTELGKWQALRQANIDSGAWVLNGVFSKLMTNWWMIKRIKMSGCKKALDKPASQQRSCSLQQRRQAGDVAESGGDEHWRVGAKTKNKADHLRVRVYWTSQLNVLWQMSS